MKKIEANQIPVYSVLYPPPSKDSNQAEILERLNKRGKVFVVPDLDNELRVRSAITAIVYDVISSVAGENVEKIYKTVSYSMHL